MPRGAEVWFVAGLGPEARIDALPCAAGDIDVLVAGPTTLRKRLHVAQSDFVSADGGPQKVADRERRGPSRSALTRAAARAHPRGPCTSKTSPS